MSGSVRTRTGRCAETVTGNGHRYVFSGTFDNIEAASFVCGDPGDLMRRLCDEELPPADLRSIILCCMDERDGAPVSANDREQYAVEFVEDFGLQDCALLAKHLLSYGLIGDVKKKQIELSETVRGLIRSPNRSTLKAFAALGLLWAVTCVTSAALVCWILRYW